MHRFASTICLLVVTNAAVAQQPSSPRGAAATVAAFAERWNRHDMHAFGQLFSADAEFVNVTASWWKGRAAIERNHAFLHGTIAQTDTVGVTTSARSHGIFRTMTLTFDSVEVRDVAPGIATAHAAWRGSGDARTTAMRKGLFLFVLKKTRGAWQIVAAQNTEASRPAELSR
jgi:ketosteroid isomerase-like protein